MVSAFPAALACEKACSASSDRDGRCYYSCYGNACHMFGSHHRDEFLNALSGRGYDCRPEGFNTLSCAKTDGFGGCFSHTWGCGGDCQNSQYSTHKWNKKWFIFMQTVL